MSIHEIKLAGDLVILVAVLTLAFICWPRKREGKCQECGFDTEWDWAYREYRTLCESCRYDHASHGF